MTRHLPIALFLLTAAAAIGSQAGDKVSSTEASAVRQGEYACVFRFGGTFFDSNPLFILPGNRYRAKGGEGSWSYSAGTRRIAFSSGVLARDFTTATYVPSGPVKGGLKNKKGPAIILAPSAAYKKIHGPEAVPLHCYLKPQE
ncbi:MAG TPA: hypothetical protein VMS96_00490 [Terriglobales bacterium]|nr:hypothetical protein [Terriglobales bacterium]